MSVEMIDLYLRSDNEDDMIAALPFARGIDKNDNGMWITGSTDYSLSVIGSVVTTSGVYDSNGEEITPPVLDTRFHVNLRCTPSIAETIPDDVIIEAPTAPVREWL